MSHSSVYGQINIKENRYSEWKKGKFALYQVNFFQSKIFIGNNGRSNITGIVTFLLIKKNNK